jgi:hypothetical protein
MKKSEGRARRGREHWAALVADWRASGTSGSEFARVHGLKPANLYYWSSVLGREADRPAAKLLPVHVAPHLVRAARFELLVGGLRLRFDEGASPAYIADLARSLGASGTR